MAESKPKPPRNKSINTEVLGFHLAKKYPWCSNKLGLEIVRLFFDIIVQAVASGDTVELQERSKPFGSFGTMPNYDNINKRYCLLPHFIPHYTLKACINGVAPTILGRTGGRPKDWKEQLAKGLAEMNRKYPLPTKAKRGFAIGQGTQYRVF